MLSYKYLYLPAVLCLDSSLWFPSPEWVRRPKPTATGKSDFITTPVIRQLADPPEAKDVHHRGMSPPQSWPGRCLPGGHPHRYGDPSTSSG